MQATALLSNYGIQRRATFNIISLNRNAIRVYILSSRVHLFLKYVSICYSTFTRDKKKKRRKKKLIDNNDESTLTKLEQNLLFLSFRNGNHICQT